MGGGLKKSQGTNGKADTCLRGLSLCISLKRTTHFPLCLPGGCYSNRGPKELIFCLLLATGCTSVVCIDVQVKGKAWNAQKIFTSKLFFSAKENIFLPSFLVVKNGPDLFFLWLIVTRFAHILESSNAFLIVHIVLGEKNPLRPFSGLKIEAVALDLPFI